MYNVLVTCISTSRGSPDRHTRYNVPVTCIRTSHGSPDSHTMYNVLVTCIRSSHGSPDSHTMYLLHVLEHLIEVLTVIQCSMISFFTNSNAILTREWCTRVYTTCIDSKI